MYFHVLLGSKHIDLIKAESEEDAVKKIEKLFGSAKLFSATHTYVAVKA